MRPFRTAAILAVLLLILGGLATWDEWKTEQEEKAEKNKNKLASFSAEEVRRLRFQAKASDQEDASIAEPVSLVAEKVDGSWRLSKPMQVQADKNTIEKLLSTLTDYSYKRVVSGKKSDWAKFGLDDPERVIEVASGDKSSKTETILVGKKAPVGYNVYSAVKGDDRVFLGSQHLLVSTAKNLRDFRDKSLVDIDVGKVERMTYHRKGQSPIVVAKNNKQDYRITKPKKLKADSAGVRDFLDEISMVTIQDFIDDVDGETAAAFAPPGYEVSWSTGNGERKKLLFTEKDSETLAAFDPEKRVFVLPSEFATKLRKDLMEFRDRRIVEMSSGNVARVQVDGDIYESVKGKWYKPKIASKFDENGDFLADGDKPEEEGHIRTFLMDLEFAKAEEFVSPSSSRAKGLPDSPLHRIKLTFKEKSKRAPVVLDLFEGASGDKRFLVRKKDGKRLYSVKKSHFQSMTPGGDEEPALKNLPESAKPAQPAPAGMKGSNSAG